MEDELEISSKKMENLVTGQLKTLEPSVHRMTTPMFKPISAAADNPKLLICQWIGRQLQILFRICHPIILGTT